MKKQGFLSHPNFLFYDSFWKEKNWPKDLSWTKKNVVSSDKDLLSWSKQVNDAFIVYYRKKIKESFQQKYEDTVQKEIYYYMV